MSGSLQAKSAVTGDGVVGVEVRKSLQTIYPVVINKYDGGIAGINEKLHVQQQQLIRDGDVI